MSGETKWQAPDTRQPVIDPKSGCWNAAGHRWAMSAFYRTGGYNDDVYRAQAIAVTGLSALNDVHRSLDSLEQQVGTAVSGLAALRGDPRLDKAVEALAIAVSALAQARARASGDVERRLERLDSLLTSLGGRTTRAQQTMSALQSAAQQEQTLQARYQTFLTQAQSEQLSRVERRFQEIAGEIASLDTTDIPEGSNLYYTAERVDDRVSVLIQNGTGLSWAYNDGAGTLTGAVSLSAFTTANLSESGNLYYTNARADARIAAAVGVSVQAFDADLTSIAALTTTAFGRSFLTLADAAAGRTYIGLGTAATANTGTSGATIPLLNAANTFSGLQTFSVSSGLALEGLSTAGAFVASFQNSRGDATGGGLQVITRWNVPGNYILDVKTNNGAQRVLCAMGDGNVGIGTTSFGDGYGNLGIANTIVAPSANPTGGGVIYAEAGALKYRGSGGTVTTLAPA